MKKLLATLLLALPVIGFSQNRGQIIDLLGMCIAPVQFAETLASYGEIPMMTMITHRMTDATIEKFESYPTVLFVNPNTGSWTLAEKRDENNYCITAIGEGIQPYIDNSANMRQGT